MSDLAFTIWLALAFAVGFAMGWVARGDLER